MIYAVSVLTSSCFFYLWCFVSSCSIMDFLCFENWSTEWFSLGALPALEWHRTLISDIEKILLPILGGWRWLLATWGWSKTSWWGLLLLSFKTTEWFKWCEEKMLTQITLHFITLVCSQQLCNIFYIRKVVSNKKRAFLDPPPGAWYSFCTAPYIISNNDWSLWWISSYVTGKQKG